MPKPKRIRSVVAVKHKANTRLVATTTTVKRKTVVDLTVEVERPVTADEVNEAFRVAAASGLNGILAVSEEPLVSVDYIGNPASSIVDLLSTFVVQEQLVKVMAWYDNEWAYSVRCTDLAQYMARKL